MLGGGGFGIEIRRFGACHPVFAFSPDNSDSRLPRLRPMLKYIDKPFCVVCDIAAANVEYNVLSDCNESSGSALAQSKDGSHVAPCLTITTSCPDPSRIRSI
jgi:hypothetical protein